MRSSNVLKIMKTLEINLDKDSYDIIIDKGVLSRSGSLTSSLHKNMVCCIVTQREIFKHHGPLIYNSFRRENYKTLFYLLPSGEEAKKTDVLEGFYRYLLDKNFDRQSLIVAFGGGVVGDLAGFAASTYMRGIPYVQIPTTLLSAVDSSVGGKTGLNFNGVKNVIGSFYQPRLVLIDVNTLRSLPKDEFTSGLGEIIKYAILSGEEMFNLIQSHIEKIGPDSPSLINIIKECCQIKGQIIAADEKEQSGLRMLLNLGHTLGHAIEMITGWRHGEAIALGLALESKFAHELGYLSERDLVRIINLIKKAGLPVQAPIIDSRLIKALITKDKKMVNNRINWVLPHSIGDVRIHTLEISKIPRIN
ncbi:MAG: 3-dehydroquinate synthase [Bacillota bacterium]